MLLYTCLGPYQPCDENVTDQDGKVEKWCQSFWRKDIKILHWGFYFTAVQRLFKADLLAIALHHSCPKHKDLAKYQQGHYSVYDDDEEEEYEDENEKKDDNKKDDKKKKDRKNKKKDDKKKKKDRKDKKKDDKKINQDTKKQDDQDSTNEKKKSNIKAGKKRKGECGRPKREDSYGEKEEAR